MSFNTIKRRIGFGIAALYVLLAEYALGIAAVLMFSLIAYVMVRTYAADPIAAVTIVVWVLIGYAGIGLLLYSLGGYAKSRMASPKED